MHDKSQIKLHCLSSVTSSCVNGFEFEGFEGVFVLKTKELIPPSYSIWPFIMILSSE